MPIPFRDADEVSELGTAGYLKIEPLADNTGYGAALFLINARGEPVELVYNRVQTPRSVLWRRDDLARHAARKLTGSLFSLCAASPRLMLCLATEVTSHLFSEDVLVSMPVCRIATAPSASAASSLERREPIRAAAPLDLLWYPDLPQPGSGEARLMQELIVRGLVLEPFERASTALREALGVEAEPKM